MHARALFPCWILSSSHPQNNQKSISDLTEISEVSDSLKFQNTHLLPIYPHDNQI